MSSFHASAKVLNFVDTRPKDNEVKGAVQLNPNIQLYLNGDKAKNNVRQVQLGDKTVPYSTFAIFDKQEDSLIEFINRLSNQLGQSHVSQNEGECAFGLMFEDGRRFVTEQNKHLIQQGFLLKFTASPMNYAQTFLTQLTRLDLRRDVSTTLAEIAQYHGLSADVAFANAMKAIGGIRQLITLIENCAFESNVVVLFQLLQILLVLMGHADVVGAECFTRKFIEKIAVYVNGSSKIENNESLHLALNIILNVMNQCDQELRNVLKEEVKFETLIRHLENSDERIILDALTLMNAIYGISDSEERQAIVKILHSKPFVAAVETVITRESRSPDQRIRVQLVQIQAILMEELRNLAMRLPTEQEIDYIMAMEEWDPKASLLKIGGTLLRHESALSVGGTSTAGIENELPIQIDEQQLEAQRTADAAAFRRIVQHSPPGLLAIDAILDFSRFASDTRLKEIQSESLLRVSGWPMVLTSLANSLITAFGICNEGTTSPKDFFQLIFKSERPFHDVFATVVELFHRTWREMHANSCDLDKVLSVVDDQIRRVLAMNPGSRRELNDFLERKLSYYHMQKIWERERVEQEELELNSAEIRALREHLQPAMEALVMERKKAFLKRGTLFTKFAVGKLQGKDAQSQQPMYWHWKLDDNERFFCYSDCKAMATGSGQIELDLTTSKKLSIFNIKRIVHGPEYSNQLSQQYDVKSTKKNQSNSLLRCGLCLELAGDGDSSGLNLNTAYQTSGMTADQIHLTTNNEMELNAWIEGINCLITPQTAAQVPAIAAEVQRMLNMEVRVRLLDVQNVPTEKAPLIPPLPSDFSWIPSMTRDNVKLNKWM